MGKTRKRGVKLDPLKVQHFARLVGVKSEDQLDTLYRTRFDIRDGQSISVIKTGWRGGTCDKLYANQLAQALNLPDYLPLLKSDTERSAWEVLLSETSRHQRFLEFHYQDQDNLRLVNLVTDNEHPSNDIPVSVRWHLELTGQPGNKIFILLRSTDVFFQLSPIDKPHHPEFFEGFSQRLPSTGKLNFDQSYGLGWRQLIAIQAPRIPIVTRSNSTGYTCSLSDLNEFAVRLKSTPNQPDYLIDTYEFTLISPEI